MIGLTALSLPLSRVGGSESASHASGTAAESAVGGWHCAVVLDEADRMLEMGFQEEIAELMEKVPTPRQTVSEGLGRRVGGARWRN